MEDFFGNYIITIDTRETFSEDDVKELISVIEDFMKNKGMSHGVIEAHHYDDEIGEYFWVA